MMVQCFRLPSFEEKIVAIPNCLAREGFAALRDLVISKLEAERVHIPVHKKGATVSYQQLQFVAPEAVALYQSEELHRLIGGIVGERVIPTPLHDQSSCSVLIYDRDGDHIGWHHDVNFYNGRHFTALLSLLNSDAAGRGLSSATLVVQKHGKEIIVPTPPNTLVLFEGTYTFHKVTALGKHERRVILNDFLHRSWKYVFQGWRTQVQRHCLLWRSSPLDVITRDTECLEQ